MLQLISRIWYDAAAAGSLLSPRLRSVPSRGR